MFPTDEQLKAVINGDIRVLCELDSQGFLLSSGETAETYCARIRSLENHYSTLERQLVEPGFVGSELGLEEILPENRIPPAILDEASVLTRNVYDFSIDWVPAFFSSRGLGVFWGGCTASSDDGTSLFVIRKAFEKKQKWFLYTRCELLSHELCHVARVPLHDSVYEEHFAYAISGSAFRRLFGNCFQNSTDALLFIIPVFLLLIIQITNVFFELDLPMFIFWCAAGIYPVFLLIRNIISRRRYFRAEQHLRAAGIEKSTAFLFRCTASDIREIARTQPEHLPELVRNKAQSELRWKILSTKYLN